MRCRLFSLSFLSLSTVLAFAASVDVPAFGQCVVADVAVQAAIHGSKKPAQQSNEVEIRGRDSCVGNTSVHTGKQIHVGGTEQVVQERRSQHRIGGNRRRNNTKKNHGSTVAVPVEVQVDVYNPAERLRD